ncbi:MAG: hypothetical protein ACRYG2_25905 [Janthinobacterium lividum]
MTPVPTSGTALRPAPGRGVRTAVTAAALVGLAVHLWGLYRDHGPPSVPWFPQADKLEHVVGFGLPCFLVLLALHLHAAAAGRLLGIRAVALVVGLFVVHAGVSEVVQGDFYTTRSGDPFDALADVVGTSLGLAGHLVLRRGAHGRA